MEKLQIDQVRDTIHRLSLEDGAPCKLVNESFETSIQHNQIYFSRWYPKIFYRLQLDPPYPILYKFERSQIPPILFNVVSSCGGLLVLRFNETYSVFNPVTGEYGLVPMYKGDIGVGLVVDSTDDFSYRFRLLVAVQVCLGRVTEEKLFRFRIITTGSRMWEDVHQEYLNLPFQSIMNLDREEYLPVYLHSSMHWLIHTNTILSFDLEKRRATIFQGPGQDKPDWFGVVRGSLVYVVSRQYDVLIHVYDQVSSEWRVQHKMQKIKTFHYAYSRINFFNGESLVMFYENKTEGEGEIYVCDILSQTWKKIGVMKKFYLGKNDEFEKPIVPFVPTKIRLYSGLYVNGVQSTHCSILQTLQVLQNAFKIESE